VFILYGRSFSNFVAVLAEDAETSACWASFASDFLGERSNLAPISFSYSSVILFIFLSNTDPAVLF
jgi:hypothetical protein